MTTRPTLHKPVGGGGRSKTKITWCDDKYALLRQVLTRRQTFFDDLRALTRYMVFDSWEQLMDFMIKGLELEARLETTIDTG
jgi:hypothetical protein